MIFSCARLELRLCTVGRSAGARRPRPRKRTRRCAAHRAAHRDALVGGLLQHALLLEEGRGAACGAAARLSGGGAGHAHQALRCGADGAAAAAAGTAQRQQQQQQEEEEEEEEVVAPTPLPFEGPMASWVSPQVAALRDRLAAMPRPDSVARK